MFARVITGVSRFRVRGDGVVPEACFPVISRARPGAAGGMQPGCSPFGRICPCRAAAGAAGCSMIMSCSPRY